MKHVRKVYLFLLLIVMLLPDLGKAQDSVDSIAVNLNLGEIVIYDQYTFKDTKEEKEYQQLEDDLRTVYPLLKLVRSEYARINKELEAYYEGEREKEFLKWYEKYARESYMHHLSVLNVRQGRLFLKMVSRELDISPYELIKKYRNGFRAVVWQGAAHVFLANLKTEYHPDKNPMIEHIMRKLESENPV